MWYNDNIFCNNFLTWGPLNISLIYTSYLYTFVTFTRTCVIPYVTELMMLRVPWKRFARYWKHVKKIWFEECEIQYILNETRYALILIAVISDYCNNCYNVYCIYTEISVVASLVPAVISVSVEISDDAHI